MPNDCFGYFAYDIIVLYSSELQFLESGRLDPLCNWVKGGGGLLLVLDDTVLKEQQIEFINSLVDAAGKTDKSFVCDNSGMIFPDVLERCGLCFFAAWLGPNRHCQG